MGTAQPGTVEVPMTAATRQLIAGDITKFQRVLLIVSVIVGILFAFFGAVLLGSLFILLGLAVGAAIYVVGRIVMKFKLSNDLKEATFVRTTGPIKVTEEVDTDIANDRDTTTYWLNLIDHRFIVNGKVETAARKVLSGTVDYTKHGHIVFDIRNDAGESVYRHAGYAPESQQLL